MAYESHYGYGDRYQYDRQRRRRERNRYEEARINRDYYDGHHWPYWVGPTLPGDAEGYAEKMSLLERAFQQHNAIATCVDHWRDGLISEPFSWHLKRPDGERAPENSEAELALQRWLDFVNQQADSFEARESDPWSEFVLCAGLEGDSYLRLWTPERFASAPDPVRRIHLHATDWRCVTVERSPDDGFVNSIIYSGANVQEKQRIDGDVIEISGISEDGIERYNTGGRLLIQGVCVRPIVSESARRLQNSINHGLTMKLRNQELSGFRENIFFNALPPGQYVADSTVPGGQRFEPSGAEERGAGVERYKMGVPTGTEVDPSLTTPSLFQSEPVEPRYLLDSVAADTAMVYREFRQGYRLSDSAAGESGESRIQMRQEFELYLRGFRRPIESAIANTLNVVLKILGYDDLEAVVSLRVTTGKLSAEESMIVQSRYDKGLLSRATAMALLGDVPDVDAELALIDEEMSEETTPVLPDVDADADDEEE